MPQLVRSLLAIVVVTALVGNAQCQDYLLSATGDYSGNTPDGMGIGFNFANENSNPFTWLQYLGTNLARIFIQPLIASNSNDPNGDRSRWRAYTSNSWNLTRSQNFGDQFGVSFGGNTVSNADDWSSAVNELRSAPGSDDFFDWLASNTNIAWRSILKPLNTSGIAASMAQLGNAQKAIDMLRDLNSDIIAVWDVRCRNLPYNSTDAKDPEYWKERWESYRLMYIGAQWMAKNGVTKLELYNEPDKDYNCLSDTMWADLMRIYSQAFQDSYADYAQVTGTDVRPTILGPSTSVGWADGYSTAIFKTTKARFATTEEEDDDVRFVDMYAFHKYGSFSKKPCREYGPNCKSETGPGLRSTFDTTSSYILIDNNDTALPAVITEFNCFTAAQAETVTHPYFVGKHVMDLPATAACIASQIAGLVLAPGGPSLISLHKMVQNLVPSNPSGIGKNGLFYAHVTASPFIITSSTKSAEAYRLILRRAISKQTLKFTTADGKKVFNVKGGRMSLWGVDDDLAYYLFLANEDFYDYDIAIDLNNLNINSGTFVTVNAVANNPDLSSSYHGEVSDSPQLTDDKTISITSLSGSFYALTVPKGQTERTTIDPSDDATVKISGGDPLGMEPTLVVSSADDLSVTLLKFDIGDRSNNLVNAILKLHLESATNESPQIVMVLGIREPWVEHDVTWDKIATLRQSIPSSIDRAADNPIYWKGPNGPSVAGHITIPPNDSIPAEGFDVRLDVTDIVRSGVTNFLMVRMFRYDQSTGERPAQLPGDKVQGAYVFTSKDSDSTENHPALIIDTMLPQESQSQTDGMKKKPTRTVKIPPATAPVASRPPAVLPLPIPLPLPSPPLQSPPSPPLPLPSPITIGTLPNAEAGFGTTAPSPLSMISTVANAAAGGAPAVSSTAAGASIGIDNAFNTDASNKANGVDKGSHEESGMENFPPWGGVNLDPPPTFRQVTEQQQQQNAVIQPTMAGNVIAPTPGGLPQQESALSLDNIDAEIARQMGAFPG